MTNWRKNYQFGKKERPEYPVFANKWLFKILCFQELVWFGCFPKFKQKENNIMQLSVMLESSNHFSVLLYKKKKHRKPVKVYDFPYKYLSMQFSNNFFSWIWLHFVCEKLAVSSIPTLTPHCTAQCKSFSWSCGIK